MFVGVSWTTLTNKSNEDFSCLVLEIWLEFMICVGGALAAQRENFQLNIDVYMYTKTSIYCRKFLERQLILFLNSPTHYSISFWTVPFYLPACLKITRLTYKVTQRKKSFKKVTLFTQKIFISTDNKCIDYFPKTKQQAF